MTHIQWGQYNSLPCYTTQAQQQQLKTINIITDTACKTERHDKRSRNLFPHNKSPTSPLLTSCRISLGADWQRDAGCSSSIKLCFLCHERLIYFIAWRACVTCHLATLSSVYSTNTSLQPMIDCYFTAGFVLWTSLFTTSVSKKKLKIQTTI